MYLLKTSEEILRVTLDLDIISVTSPKCIAHFEAAWREFSHMRNAGSKTNQHGNMSCFSDSPTFISANQKPHTMKYEPRNLNLKTYHPLKHVTFQRAT
jgi:hypothetical protein